MPPRHAYWTIILEGKPTAFRAHSRDELAPTLRQLQARHPDAVMMWFARGRLWESPEAQRDAMMRRHKDGERRGPEWRPGGSHRDPRDRFKVPRDEKRRRFSERMRGDRRSGPGSSGVGASGVGRPGSGDRPPGQGRRPERRDKAPRWNRENEPGAPSGDRPPWQREQRPGRPRNDRSRRPARPGGRGPRKPGGGGRRGGGGGGSR